MALPRTFAGVLRNRCAETTHARSAGCLENDDERHADADRRIIHKFEELTAKHQGLLDDAAPRIDQGDN
jgi:hypothetical protein